MNEDDFDPQIDRAFATLRSLPPPDVWARVIDKAAAQEDDGVQPLLQADVTDPSANSRHLSRRGAGLVAGLLLVAATVAALVVVARRPSPVGPSSTDPSNALQIDITSIDETTDPLVVTAEFHYVGTGEALLTNYVLFRRTDVPDVPGQPYLVGCLKTSESMDPLQPNYSVAMSLGSPVECGIGQTLLRPGAASELILTLDSPPAGTYRLEVAGYASNTFRLEPPIVEASTSTEPHDDDGTSKSGWQKLPDAPLDARSAAVLAELDGHIVVTGGWDFLCPPGADCGTDDVTRFVDGAWYDPAENSWVPIADAPFPLLGGGSTTSGENLYVAAACSGHSACDDQTAILRYRSADDEWDVLPAPDELPSPQLTTLSDGTVIAFSSSDEQGESPDYRLVGGSRWEVLPDDPLPAVYDRFVLGDGQLVYVFGSPIAGDQPTKLGAVFDVARGTWTELTASNAAGYQVWAGDDGFYLNPHFGPSVEGGRYDPSTDTWSGLPEPPASASWRDDMAGVLLERDATYEYASGWVRDTATDQWIEIPPRPDAPTEDESITNSGRRLLVYGGQLWTGEGGELLNELWSWTPPSNPS